MNVTPLYAALLGLFFIALSVRTVMARNRLAIAIGDSGDADMLRTIRVHANFAEYVPLALVLFFLVEVRGGPPLLVHALGASLVVGRLVHAWGVSRRREDFRFRVTGMALTLSSIGVAALALLGSLVRSVA